MTSERDRGFFGHPRGLMTLFFTEMWERFSYYGMRAILILFMTTAAAEGGMGLSDAEAGIVYGLYTSSVWLLPLLGGWLADNVVGMRRAVLWGGIVIMTGHVLLTLHGVPTFYSGLACVAIGTGLLKPNISAIVGQLYSEEDRRRDSGFSIFYMGINVGSSTAPLVCGWLAQHEWFKGLLQGWGIDPALSWHWGFGAAAVGMFFGLVQYVATARNLGAVGLKPAGATTPEGRAHAKRTLAMGAAAIAVVAGGLLVLALSNPEGVTKENVNLVYTFLLFGSVGAFFAWLFASRTWSARERRRLLVIAVLFLGSCVFWGAFEQAGSTLNLFADRETRNALFGWEFPSSWWQSVNGAMIVLLAPLFAWTWARLGDFDRSSMARFSIGILFAGLGHAVLIGGALQAEGDAKAGVGWLLTVYLCHTIGELCLSPVGLSSMTKLAPQRVQGLMLGVWFASISIGSFVGGRVAGVYQRFELPTLFAVVAGVTIAIALIMAILIRPVSRLVQERGAPATPRRLPGEVPTTGARPGTSSTGSSAGR